MSEQLVNNAQTTLNGAIDDNDLTLVVTSAAPFPTTGEFRIIVKAEGANSDEIMLVTSVSGTTYTVLRAYEATAGVQAASAHASGATVAHVLTAGSLRALSVPTGFIGAKAYNSAVQAINTTTAALTFNSEEFDTNNFHDTSSNTSRMTIPAGMGGKYLLQASAATSTASMTDAYFQLNGATRLRAATAYASSDNGGRPYLNVYQDLSAGDYVECFITTVGSCNLGSATQGEDQAVFSITKLDGGKVGRGVGAKAYNSTTQNVNNTTAALTLDSEEFDTDGFHSTSSNTSRHTIPTGMGGIYLLQAGTYGNGGTINYTGFRKNGSGTTTPDIRGLSHHGTTYHTSSSIVELVSGDYVEYVADTSSSVNIGHASGVSSQTWFSIMRLDSNGTGVLASGKVTRTAGNYSTTSSFADVTDMSITLTTGAHQCLITVSATVSSSTATYSTPLDITVDSVRQGTTTWGLIRNQAPGNGYTSNASFTYTTATLSAGSHTFKLQAMTESGATGSVIASDPPLIMTVQELPDSGVMSSGGSGQYGEAFCSADTTLTTANTWQDVTGMSLSLGPGVWDVEGYCSGDDSNANTTSVELAIHNGTSRISSTVCQKPAGSGERWQGVVGKILNLSTTTTVKIQASSTRSGTSVVKTHHTFSGVQVNNTASRLRAIRIA